MYCDENYPYIQQHASDIQDARHVYNVDKNRSDPDIRSHGTIIPNQGDVPD